MKPHGIIVTGNNSWEIMRSAGAHRLAYHLKDEWDVDILDYAYHWSIEQIIEFLKSKVTENTKWIGVSYTWLSEDLLLESKILAIRTNFPNLLLIMGGQNFYKNNLGADYYTYGFAEHGLKKILDYEFSDGPPLVHSFLHGGKFVNCTEHYPAPNLESYNSLYTPKDFLDSNDVLPIELSRGCKFKCKFCSFPFVGIREDTSSSEDALYSYLNDIYQQYGITKFIITDDTINDRIEKLVKLRNVVNRLSFTPEFTGYVRADLFKAHPEHVELLAESRVWGQHYGVETFDANAAKKIGKGLNPEIMKDILLETKSYFNKHLGLYRGTCSFIVGLPGESIDSIFETQTWLLDNWYDQSWSWHALKISNVYGVMSAFGEDFSKFGYYELNSPSKEEGSINWANEHMTHKVAKTIADSLMDSESQRCKYPTSWILWNVLSFYEPKIALQKETINADEQYFPLQRKKIQSYIQNKLKV